MKKILYVLSFILDMVLLPISILLSFIAAIIYYVKYKDELELKIIDSIKLTKAFIQCQISEGMNTHKERILGI